MSKIESTQGTTIWDFSFFKYVVLKWMYFHENGRLQFLKYRLVKLNTGQPTVTTLENYKPCLW